MPQFNLTTLSGHELRQYLDSSRARGDATLAYQILEEMAVRRERGAKRRKARAAGEPRVVTIELDEPKDDEDDLPPAPLWRPPLTLVSDTPEPAIASVAEASGPEAPKVEAARRPPPVPPVELATWDLRMPAADPPERAAPRARRSLGVRARIAAAFVIGALAGVGAGWWAGMQTQAAPPLAPVAVAVASAPAAAPATPIVVAEVAAPTPTPEPAAPETMPVAVEEPPAPPAEAVVVTPEAEPVETAAAESSAGACATAPTPADREICADPELQRLQRDLRHAYAQALEAHEDRALLRQRQLAWRDARNTVSDPGRLARLYEQRIQKLNAATAQARAER